MFHIGLYLRKKNFFAETSRPRALIFGMYNVASPSRPLPSLFKLCPWGQKWSHVPVTPQYMAIGSHQNFIFVKYVNKSRRGLLTTGCHQTFWSADNRLSLAKCLVTTGCH